MRYFATLPGDTSPRPLEVEPLGEGRYAVTHAGVRHELDASVFDGGALSLLIDGASYEVELEDVGEAIEVRVRGAVVSVDLADERRLRMRAASGKFTAEGKQTINAPMPGKVVKLLVQVGDEVVAGQGLVIVEAMKMENELKSPRAGKVTELVVKEGQTVEGGTKLAVVE